jgi:hypothetical protein
MEFIVRYGKLLIGYNAILSVTLILAVNTSLSIPKLFKPRENVVLMDVDFRITFLIKASLPGYPKSDTSISGSLKAFKITSGWS